MKANDMTMQQLRVMLLLHRNGPMRTTDVALSMGVSTPTITGIMDRLVFRGCVLRTFDRLDRRAVLHSLTHDGGMVLRDVAAMLQDVLAERAA